jgi:hypothetical protein
MSTRRLLFLLGLFLIPSFFGIWRVSPLLERRTQALTKQAGADQVHFNNLSLLSQRDRLADAWTEFQPQADAELADLQQRIHPVLVQKRVFELAKSYQCTLRIQAKKDRFENQSPTFAISAEGEWNHLVQLMAELETGPHRIRLEQVGLVLPSTIYEDGGVRLHGILRLPAQQGGQG